MDMLMDMPDNDNFSASDLSDAILISLVEHHQGKYSKVSWMSQKRWVSMWKIYNQ